MQGVGQENEKLNRILSIMRLLQAHLETANFDITEFEEVEIFLDLALAAGERYRSPANSQYITDALR